MTASTSTVTPMSQPAQAAASQLSSGGVIPSTWFAIIHLLINLPLGVAYFTVLAVAVSSGLGLLITLLGIPILIGAGGIVHALGNFERARSNAFLGTTLRNPYRPADPDAGWIARLLSVVKDPSTGRDFLYLMLRLPVGIFTFTAMVAVWALTIALLASPFSYWLGFFRIQIGLWIFDGFLAMTMTTFGGVLMAILAFGITRGLVRLETVLASALLDVPPEELKRRVADLASSRTRTMSAADQDRRRLERDLHDGAQQRMVSLAMTLGLAQQKLTSDPQMGAKLVAEAHEEAKRALQDLRDLARGIHPAILTDHGLDAALPALAARSDKRGLCQGRAPLYGLSATCRTLPYTLAIHAGRAESGEEHNPHAHLMFSERRNDGIERSRDQWFKRANSAHPERGGAPKSRTFHGAAWVEQARERWASLTNEKLAEAGRPERVDHRSYARQGIDRQPGEHYGPSAAHMVGRGDDHDRLESASSVVDDEGALRAVNSQITQLEAERAAIVSHGLPDDPELEPRDYSHSYRGDSRDDESWER